MHSFNYLYLAHKQSIFITCGLFKILFFDMQVYITREASPIGIPIGWYPYQPTPDSAQCMRSVNSKAWDISALAQSGV